MEVLIFGRIMSRSDFLALGAAVLLGTQNGQIASFERNVQGRDFRFRGAAKATRTAAFTSGAKKKKPTNKQMN